MYVQQNNSIPQQMTQFWTDYMEKRRIHKTAWAVAIPGFVFFLTSLFLGVILALLGARLGIGIQAISKIVSDPVLIQVLEIVLSLVLMTVPFIIPAKIAGYNISASGGFNKPKKGTVLPCLLFGIGFCAFANLAVAQAERFLERFGIDYSVNSGTNPEGVYGFLMVLISTVIVPGILEEFAFRGIVLGMLRPYGEAFALIASAAMFGMLHGNFEQIPFAFLVGLVLGFIRIKSGSVLICMVIHASNNLIAVVTSYWDGLPAAMLNLIYTVYILFALIVAVLGILLLKHKGAFSFPKTERPISAGKTYRYFFFSPAMIIFFCLFFTRALISAINF